jgi:hypothetical protein
MDDHLLLDLGPPLAVDAVGDRLHRAGGEVLAQPVALLGAHDRQVGHLAEALTVSAPPGGTYFSSEVTTASPQPPLRALVRNTGTSQVAIAVTVTPVVLTP